MVRQQAAAPEPGTVAAKSPSDATTKLSFNFRYAPWADVLKLFAEAANLTLDLNDVPPGTFNYFDDRTYTVTQALDVMNGYLLPKGYALIRRDRFLVSLNIDNPIPPSMVQPITMEELMQRGANELVIVDVPVEILEADKIVGEVRELVGPWGKVAAVKSTNSLNIMDTASNIRRIVRLLKQGTPVIVTDKDNVFKAISLKHITATEAERTIRRLFGLNPAITSTPAFGGFGPFGGGFGGFGGGGFGRGGGGGDFGGGRGNDQGGGRGGDNRDQQQQQQRPQFPTAGTQATPSPYLGKIQVTADPRTNHLLVTSTVILVKVVEDAVKSIDIPQDPSSVKTENPTSIKSYIVPGGDPTQAAQTINSIYPGLVAGVDTRSGRIYVQGTDVEHREIESLIKTLGGLDQGSVAVIPLIRLDPLQAANSLKNLFATDARPPTIEADAQGRRLMIRGSADQLAQINIMLQKLGETGGAPHNDKEDRGPTRTIGIGAHDPEDIERLVRQYAELSGQRSSIRIVVPGRLQPDSRTFGPRGATSRHGPGTGWRRQYAAVNDSPNNSYSSCPSRRPGTIHQRSAQNVHSAGQPVRRITRNQSGTCEKTGSAC